MRSVIIQPLTEPSRGHDNRSTPQQSQSQPVVKMLELSNDENWTTTSASPSRCQCKIKESDNVVVEVVVRDPVYDVRETFQLSGADRARVDTSSRRQPVNLSEPRTTRIFRPLQRTMEALRHKSNKNPKWRPEGLYITLLRIATRNQAVPGEMVLMDLKL